MNRELVGTGMTPFRKGHLIFEENEDYISEPAYQFGRPANAMFKQSGKAFNQLVYNSGWCIKSYHEDLAVLTERTEAAGSFLIHSAGTITIAPNFIEEYSNRAPTETGITTGASAHLAAQSFKQIFKSVDSSVSWDTNRLVGDQTAYPFNLQDPSEGYGIDDTIPLDRIAVSTDNDNLEKDIFFFLSNYAGAFSSPGEVARFYFTARAGDDSKRHASEDPDDHIGVGQYCLRIYSTGIFRLFELNKNNTFIFRYAFKTQMLEHFATGLGVYIYKNKGCRMPNDGGNGYIKFGVYDNPQSNTAETSASALIEQLINAAVFDIAEHHIKKFHYSIPGPQSTPTTVNKIRIDLRRDLMSSFCVSWFKYPTAAITANDGLFELPFTPYDTTVPFVFSFSGCLPDGTSIDAKLCDFNTGNELVLLSSTPSRKNYQIVPNQRKYFVRITLQSSGDFTPVFFAWHIRREGVVNHNDGTEWEIGDVNHPRSGIRSFKVTGTGRELSAESFEATIVDPLNTLVELKGRSSIPFRYETEYDPTDSTKRCVLFKGVMERAYHDRKNPDNSGYPAIGNGSFTLKGKGIWFRLEENFVDAPITTTYDPETGEPYLVVDMIHSLISRTGFDFDTKFNFPTDSTVKLYASDNDFSQSIDMLAKVGDVVKSLARDYLSEILLFDLNLDKWKLNKPPVAPYEYKANFVTGYEFDTPHLVHYLPSYSTIASVPSAPILSRSPVRSSVIPPEANWLIVTTIGLFTSQMPALCCSQPIINPKSFGPTATRFIDGVVNPDFLGRRRPIYVFDPALGSCFDEDQMGLAINALARRIAKLTFFGIKTLTFEAPLLLITHEDDPTKKRALRYYDPVTVTTPEGTSSWLVRSVSPAGNKDEFQSAVYELEAPRF